ncbi:MAG: OmpA family protein [Lewinellaceae bacterium]|nr:OmpA family protein [Lewinellaceae bacterium]
MNRLSTRFPVPYGWAASTAWSACISTPTQSELKAESEEELANLLEFMEAHPAAVIEVRGHTNNLSGPTPNLNELSTNRAKVVADWLVAKGIAAERVQHKGYGWTMPILPNINAEGRKKTSGWK